MREPIILAVDTTGETVTVAVAGRSLSKAGGQSDEVILPLVEKLLKKAGLRWTDLAAVAAASGPGRFTGIRVGMSFAMAVGSELKRPALAVSRLEAAALKAGGGKVLAALDGWKEEVNFQRWADGKPAAEPEWCAGPDWETAALKAQKDGYRVERSNVDAVDLIPVALKQLGLRRRPAFRPLYLKPASYERPRA